MRLSGALVNALVVIGALLALGGGAAAGSALAARASEPGHETLQIINPAFATESPDQPLRSRGGFTGFDGLGSLGGAAVRVGAVNATGNGAFEVVSQGSSLSVRATSTARLFRLRPTTTAIQSGDAVVVRVGADGTATSILRVPRDLNEGGNGRPVPTPTAATLTPTSTPTR